MKFTYLQVDFFSIIIPFLFSFHRKIRFDKYFPSFFAGNLLCTLGFVVWDVLFTKAGIWGFSDQYTLHYRIINLPAEEILFFVSIPFSCIFTYHCFVSFFKIEWKSSFENKFILLFSAITLLGGIVYIDKIYTSTTLISTAVLLLVFKYYLKVIWLSKFFTTYALLLIPFFIVNGILTGAGLEQPVVWYNNAENSGVRLSTIPIEDLFYGMEMILLNLFFFEKFKMSSEKNEKTMSPHVTSL